MGYKTKEEMAGYVRRRYLLLKIKAIDYKGGECLDCGYKECSAAMAFHHRNPSEKEYDWSKLRKRSWDSIKLELDKCDLLCCRCHSERHYDPTILEEAKEWMSKRKKKPSSTPYEI